MSGAPPRRLPGARPAAGTAPGGRRDSRRPGGPTRSRPTGPGGRPAGSSSSPTVPLQVRRPLPPHIAFAERLLAVLSGERPVHWMLGHTIGEAYDQLIRLAAANPLCDPAEPGGRGARPVLRRCGGSPPRPGVVEAYATIAAGGRVRAMAFRLELGVDRRWRCAAVELGGIPEDRHAPAPAPHA
ncbi:Rv3235 family protein [Streptomyces coeruleoprunus]|uniref:Rv3235 family protein n=1 Tax=Streptomyces coeruleoprunus TaxID=285563 RepID=UPI0035ED8210